MQELKSMLHSHSQPEAPPKHCATPKIALVKYQMSLFILTTRFHRLALPAPNTAAPRLSLSLDAISN